MIVVLALLVAPQAELTARESNLARLAGLVAFEASERANPPPARCTAPGLFDVQGRLPPDDAGLLEYVVAGERADRCPELERFAASELYPPWRSLEGSLRMQRAPGEMRGTGTIHLQCRDASAELVLTGTLPTCLVSCTQPFPIRIGTEPVAIAFEATLTCMSSRIVNVPVILSEPTLGQVVLPLEIAPEPAILRADPPLVRFDAPDASTVELRVELRELGASEMTLMQIPPCVRIDSTSTDPHDVHLAFTQTEIASGAHACSPVLCFTRFEGRSETATLTIPIAHAFDVRDEEGRSIVATIAMPGEVVEIYAGANGAPILCFPDRVPCVAQALGATRERLGRLRLSTSGDTFRSIVAEKSRLVVEGRLVPSLAQNVREWRSLCR
jgi:hypothetical protein